MSNTATKQSLNQATMQSAMAGRLLRDRIFQRVMSVGGVGVIVAILAIFVYLASVVVPLFTPPAVSAAKDFVAPGGAERATLLYTAEEQREIGLRVTDAPAFQFFQFASGQTLREAPLKLPEGTHVTAFAEGSAASYAMALGLSDGSALVVKPEFKVSFDGAVRRIEPQVIYPLGDAPLKLALDSKPIVRLGMQQSEDGLVLAALSEGGRFFLSGVNVQRNQITGEVSSEVQQSEIIPVPSDVRKILVEDKQREMYLLSGASDLIRYDITDKAAPKLLETVKLTEPDERVTQMILLSGGFSIIVGTDKGKLSQWFLVRTEGANFKLQKIRDFTPMNGAITALSPEFHRKGFIVGNDRGELGSYFATSNRQLFVRKLSDRPLVVLGIPPRGNGYIAQDDHGRTYVAAVENHHPEVSWSALLGKVWYESYEEPAYIWQSAAANADFEPKFSLAPLSYGTIKAAFYAMIVAVPLALLGAIFTAYFMSPRMSSFVKPTIEIMQALPTVVLGFLAGLWLAPYVENNLAGVLLCLLLFPFGILLASLVFNALPEPLRRRVPPGWEAAVLIPVIILMFWGLLSLGHPIEAMFFDGDMPYWLSNTMGIKFEQRNSLVVGIAMGFAVTPTIFSIAEDAIFSVPKHLTAGSLALGATPWQTLTRVVLPTASPGIFSAIMIGLGRAVGETMIVLMATGNTAVMDFSVFTGFRTLSANIGVEMPEAAVGETHYRLLFLSALVLFGFTFVVNTLAELVRQRLRDRYSAI
ncbi:MAG: ABC transporter permease subunit [Tepidimonas sp.]|uniref:ABC transporter permease subunit n=1 Tax=Tepidimonas sp. TaxID=2002775 RepID=UPI004054C812